MAERRRGKPYIHVTWLAKALADPDCLWRYWFASHFSYQKFEEMALDLRRWNREHNELMAARREELEEGGFRVFMESANEFKLEGSSAVIAGKPDIVGQLIDTEKPERSFTLLVDGKTGSRRDSDMWQVRFYLYALPLCRKDRVVGDLRGEVQYRAGDTRVPVDLSAEHKAQMFEMVRILASDEPPRKVASRSECKFCNIGKSDCPERVMEASTVSVGDF